MTRRNRRSTHVGSTLETLLAARQQAPRDLALKLDLTPSYVSQVSTGRRIPSPSWLDNVAAALDLSNEERVELHRAGARDAGYKLDLTPDPKKTK